MNMDTTTTTTTCVNTANGSDPQKCTANSQAQQNNYDSSSIMKDYGGERENSDSPQSPIGGGATKKTATTMPLSSTWSIYGKEFQEQLHTSLPTWCGMLLYKFPWLVSLRFVGALGAQELAAAALATTLCNVTGLSLSVGLSSAMTTLAGQARGDLLQKVSESTRASASSPHTISTIRPKNGKTTKEDTQPLLLSSKKNGPNGGATTNYTSTCVLDASRDDDDDDAPPKVLLPMVFLYRGIFIQLLFVIPMGLWWISGIQQFLLHLGQEETLAAMTEVRFVRHRLFWGVYFLALILSISMIGWKSTAHSAHHHCPSSRLLSHPLSWNNNLHQPKLYTKKGISTNLDTRIMVLLVEFYPDHMVTDHGNGQCSRICRSCGNDPSCSLQYLFHVHPGLGISRCCNGNGSLSTDTTCTHVYLLVWNFGGSSEGFEKYRRCCNWTHLPLLRVSGGLSSGRILDARHSNLFGIGHSRHHCHF